MNAVEKGECGACDKFVASASAIVWNVRNASGDVLKIDAAVGNSTRTHTSTFVFGHAEMRQCL